MAAIKRSFEYGPRTVVLETGEIARQATAAVMASMGDTVVLVSVVGNKTAIPGRDFFPLTVDYQERTYAAGKIPGGFFKREGRPSEKETLTSRLIDRPLRPLFPKGFHHEVQIIATVLSLDPEIDPDIPALIGASAAVSLSGLPFDGPIGAARVGYIDGQYVLNPTFGQLATSALNLVVAGTKGSVLMVESEADQLSEEVMLGAVMFGHAEMQVAIDNIRALREEAGAGAWIWSPPEADQALEERVRSFLGGRLRDVYAMTDKLARRDALGALRKEAVAALGGGTSTDAPPAWSDAQVAHAFERIEHELVRHMILEEQKRIDGRPMDAVRPIQIRVGLLPRTHGSALFTRGETQALVITALGTERDAQIIDAIEGERRDPFLLHYNFPPYCVGETGRVGSPKRREIGHGRSGQARGAGGHAGPGGVPLCDPRGVRDHRIERIELHGHGVRDQPLAHGCRCSGQGAGRGHRHGPRQGG